MRRRRGGAGWGGAGWVPGLEGEGAPAGAAVVAAAAWVWQGGGSRRGALQQEAAAEREGREVRGQSQRLGKRSTSMVGPALGRYCSPRLRRI
jgi:hypothetical protein